MSAQCKIQVRSCGAGAGMGVVLRKDAVLGTGAGMVRVRFAGAVLVRVKIFAHFGQWKNLINLRKKDIRISLKC